MAALSTTVLNVVCDKTQPRPQNVSLRQGRSTGNKFGKDGAFPCPLTHRSLSVPLSSKESMENCNSLPSESLGEFSEREETPASENP